MHTAEPEPGRVVASHLGPRELAPDTRAELHGLGYRVVPAAARARHSSRHPDLRLVSARHLDRVPSRDQDPHTPIVIVGRPRDGDTEDARIVGHVQRPVETLALYPLLQRALERHPRSVPRVRSELSARCIRADRRWPAAVTSLSEGGCLLRGGADLEPGAHFNVQFALPSGDLVTTRARCIYRHEQQAGMAFAETGLQDRHAIRRFVSQRLALC